MHSLSQLAPLKPLAQSHVQVPTSSTPSFWHILMQALNERWGQIGNTKLFFLHNQLTQWIHARHSFYSFTKSNHSGIVTLSKNRQFCWTRGVQNLQTCKILSALLHKDIYCSHPQMWKWSTTSWKWVKGEIGITQVSGHFLQSTNHTPSPLNKVTAWRS